MHPILVFQHNCKVLTLLAQHIWYSFEKLSFLVDV